MSSSETFSESALPASDASEASLPAEILGHVFSSLSLPSLGRAGAVCSRWHDTGHLAASTLWHRQAERLGYMWGWGEAASTARSLQCGGWKAYVRRERDHERLWTQPGGGALGVRVLAAGHKHWVPSILMDPKSREMVTCSYDGTIRFWSNVDAARPGCFKVLSAGPAEGFSCISMLPLERGSVLLAAGSELGSLHVWEAWRPEDAVDARAVRARQEEAAHRAIHRRGLGRSGRRANGGVVDDDAGESDGAEHLTRLGAGAGGASSTSVASPLGASAAPPAVPPPPPSWGGASSATAAFLAAAQHHAASLAPPAPTLLGAAATPPPPSPAVAPLRAESTPPPHRLLTTPRLYPWRSAPTRQRMPSLRACRTKCARHSTACSACSR